MQLEFLFPPGPFAAPPGDWLLVGGRAVRLWVVRHPRARRYVLRLRPDGSARVTVPRGGSARAARAFAAGQTAWLARQLQRQAALPVRPPRPWALGTEILFRGEWLRLEPNPGGAGGGARLGDQLVPVPAGAVDLRPAVELHLRRVATAELTARTLELAAAEGLTVRRVTVRNQRSRWGSCSRRGTISLNWRLIQAPPFVRDYLIWHELAHLRHMNHSTRFWQEVERLCPGHAEAERWLRRHGRRLG